MPHTTTAENNFLASGFLGRRNTQDIVAEALSGADDGELYCEYTQSENLSWDDGRLREASFNTHQGFGLRAVVGECTGYAHASELSESALRRAATTVRAVQNGYTGSVALGSPALPSKPLYPNANPVDSASFEDKVALLARIDRYLRDSNPLVRQVSISLSSHWKLVHLIRADGKNVLDVRPLVRFDVSVVVEKDGRMERGHTGCGGRFDAVRYLQPEHWQPQADEALRQALVNLEAAPAPAGEMDVVLGNGWPGILLHEAIGHGLEGDFNRKKTSVFSELMGKRVAAPGVTVVDDGTIEGRRGSLTVDDEGTPTEKTVLIEDGILVGYMQDRLNARLMGMTPTGNGRRESYQHMPLPRMTNTYMLGGTTAPEEMIASVKRGLYAVNFGGGQVDITSGKFVFSASEAYRIENGKITVPVKGATLIGSGADVLTRISTIGNDMALDNGIGTCGKAGQGVPVGVGQPSMLIRGLTVGGTEVL